MNQKRCSKCKEEKSPNEFYCNFNNKDGLSRRCKECHIAKVRAYREANAGKRTYRRYNNSPKGIATGKRYREKHRAKSRKRAKKTRQQFPERIKAMHAVWGEIRAGRLQRPSELPCEYRGEFCRGRAKDYHHQNYESDHWLDVVPVCRPCHREIDKGHQK